MNEEAKQNLRRSTTIDIAMAASIEDMNAARSLFLEYANSLDFELDFQNFQAELDGLPGSYARPNGVLLLARVEERLAGCVAVRPIGESICEMKRLWVKPEHRRYGLGRILAVRAIEFAQSRYQIMRLDTVQSMTQAVALYRSLGFYEIEPYYFNPLPNVLFLERKLANVG